MQGFDIDSPVSESQAQQYASDGYAFAIRYISRQSSEQRGDLTHSEATDILNGGLALMPVQHVEQAGWTPSGSIGTTYGTNAASNAQSVGFPGSVNVWLDLEGVASGTSSQAVIDYCNNWYDAVANAGFTPGLYVGANSGLTGDQLASLKFKHFWKSLSDVPSIPGRGYEMVQSAGDGKDDDVTHNDEQGDSAIWVKE
jgi:hypothetical protein